MPPEDGTGRGKGYIGFIVRPVTGLTTGTEIKNVALISFDRQTVIATNQADPFDPTSAVINPSHPDYGRLNARNTIDITPPTSSISPLAPILTTSNLTLTWGGTDLGSGIAKYDIFVSINGGSFEPLLVNTSLTSSDFTLKSGNQFAFYSVAVDEVGNRETGQPVIRSTNVQLNKGDYNGDGYPEVGDYQLWRASFGETGQGLAADGNQNEAIDAGDYVFWRKNSFIIVHDSIGDYNADGRIDLADYGVWRASYGQTGVNLPADGNHDGIIDGGDYLIWRRRNGSLVVLPASGSSVGSVTSDPITAGKDAENDEAVALAQFMAEPLIVSVATPALMTTQSVVGSAAIHTPPTKPGAEAIHAHSLPPAVTPRLEWLPQGREVIRLKRGELKSRPLQHAHTRFDDLLLTCITGLEGDERETTGAWDRIGSNEDEDRPEESATGASDEVFELLGSFSS